MSDQETKAKGRKFAALIMAGVLLVLLCALSAVMAWKEVEIPPGIGVAIGALAGCFPGYMAVNGWVHQTQARAGVTE